MKLSPFFLMFLFIRLVTKEVNSSVVCFGCNIQYGKITTHNQDNNNLCRKHMQEKQEYTYKCRDYTEPPIYELVQIHPSNQGQNGLNFHFPAWMMGLFYIPKITNITSYPNYMYTPYYQQYSSHIYGVHDIFNEKPLCATTQVDHATQSAPMGKKINDKVDNFSHFIHFPKPNFPFKRVNHSNHMKPPLQPFCKKILYQGLNAFR